MGGRAPSLKWVPSHIAEGPSQVRHEDGWLLCEVPSDEYARLIAAAPDLLEALKEAVEIIENNSLYDAAPLHALIARAEGRS